MTNGVINLKETGVVRRLDELGRVVIPKEIRKRLKIKNGDMVDIYTSDDVIILQKYHPLNQDLIPIKAILDSIKKEYNFDLLLFDDSKVIYSTIADISSGSIVSIDFSKKADAYIDKEISSKLNLNIIDGYLFNKDLYIQRILANYEQYGYIAVIDDMISKKHKEALSIINNYFMRILEH